MFTIVLSHVRLPVLLLAFCLQLAVSAAAATGDAAIEPVRPGTTDLLMPYVDNSRTDCTNLLAVRLSLQQGTGEPPLNDCSSETFTQSPPLSALDCSGQTANDCAARYQQELPHAYMSGGWNANQELWYLPLADDVGEGNLCLDGTRQFVYVDKAVAWQCSNSGDVCQRDSECGAGHCETRDVESDRWVFYTQGGTNCGSAQGCLDKYLSGEGTMSTLQAGFSHDGAGILSDDPRNPFHGANRVRLRKCTKDGFMGNATRPMSADEARPSALFNKVRYEFDLHFHGYRQWLATFDKLANGVADHREFYGQCLNDSDCINGDTCIVSIGDAPVRMCRDTKSLPPLRDASNVLLVGWSGGSNALAHTGDALVEHLTGSAQPVAPNATVGLAFDAPWKPGLASDTAFAVGSRNMYLVGDSDIPTEDAPLLLPEDEDAAVEYPADAYFSNATYVDDGETRLTNLFRNDVDDASCLSIHGPDTWHCRERNYLLAHHVTAPSFTRMAQRDSSGKDSPGSKHLHSRAPCRQDPSEHTCYDWVDEDYRQRNFQQSADYHRDFGWLGLEGPGAPNRGVFAPDNTAHNGIESEMEFMETQLVQCREDGTALHSFTLAEAMATWVQTGARVGAVERMEGEMAGQGFVWVNAAACSVCPSVSSAQVFSLDDELGEWDMSACPAYQ
ncbi:MAG: pectin acetylesterase-family hydrolase [Gammaproteobacteria bacterium]